MDGSAKAMIDPATARAISALARQIRMRDAETKAANMALAVCRRFPLYTLLGGHRHRLFNEDIFETKESEAAE